MRCKANSTIYSQTHTPTHPHTRTVSKHNKRSLPISYLLAATDEAMNWRVQKGGEWASQERQAVSQFQHSFASRETPPPPPPPATTTTARIDENSSSSSSSNFFFSLNAQRDRAGTVLFLLVRLFRDNCQRLPLRQGKAK